MKNILAGLIDRRTGVTALMIFSLAMLLLCAGTENANSAVAPGSVKWTSGVIAGNNFDGPAAIGANGTIYVGAQDGNLYAFLPGSATPKWTYNIDSSSVGITSAPAIGADGTIYVTAADGHLFAVTDNNTTAAIKWQYPGSGADALGALHGSPALGTDGTIYVGSHDQYFYAIAPPAAGGAVGTFKWSYKANSEINSSPAIGADGTIYVVDSGGYLLALKDNGTAYTLKWQYPAASISGLQDSSPAIGPDGTIYVGGTVSATSTPILYAINPNGSEKWTYPISGYGIDYQSPVIAPDGTIYIGTGGDDSNAGYLYAITDNVTDATSKWRYGIPTNDPAVPYGIDDSPAIDSNGVIYFGASDGFAYAINSNGTKKWSCLVKADLSGGSLRSSPAIGPDGTIYIGSAGQDVFYAIYGDSTGPATSAWPLFNHDSKRTGQSLADLAVTALPDPPAKLWAGHQFSITDTVTNQSLIGPSNAASTTRYYLSTDGDIDATSVLLGSRSVPIVPTGGTSPGTLTFTIPANIALVSYYLIACADDTSLIRETDETNNCTTAAGTTLVVLNIDLAVTSINKPPATAAWGSKLSVTTTVKNQGTVSAGASTMSYYLSTSNSRNPGSIPFTATRSVPSLAGGKSSTGTTMVTIPNGTPLGPYYLLACADDTGLVTETDETNNCIATATMAVTAPDLSESSVGAPPPTVASGGKLSITDTVTNGGNAIAAASVTQYYLSKSGSKDADAILLVGKRSVPTLKAPASSAGAANVTIPADIPSGNYHLLACADDTGKVTESDETNNCNATKETTSIISPNLKELSVVGQPTTVVKGGKLSVTDTVQNIGDVPAAASVTNYYLSKTNTKAGSFNLGTRSVPSLKALAISKGTVSVTVSVAVGDYFLLACADDPGKITESDETDNCTSTATAIINVIAPDLIESSVDDPPVLAGLGGTFSVTDTVQNIGDVAAAASITNYYLSINGIKDVSAVYVGKRSVPSIKAGLSNKGSAAVTIPAATNRADYYLLACADAPGKILERDENNNCNKSANTITVDQPILGEKDVSNTDISSHAFAVTDTVYNAGPVPSSASVTRYYLTTGSDKNSVVYLLGGSRSVPALSASAVGTPGGTAGGTAIKVTVPRTNVPKGVYNVIACSNDTNQATNGLSNCTMSSSANKIDCTFCHNKIYMYATKTLYDGNLKGTKSDARTGADAIAKASLPPGLAGKTAHALISISAADSIANMPDTFGLPKGIPVVSANDNAKVIGNNWADLLDGGINMSLGAALSMPNTFWWWSGSSGNGAFDSINNCIGWTSNSASVKGIVGNKNVGPGPGWINDTPFNGNGKYYVIGIAY